MLSTAMKAPRVAPITAIQVFVETAGMAGAAAGGPRSLAGTASRVGCRVVMVVSSSHEREDSSVFGQLRGSAPREARRFSVSRSATTSDLVLTVGTADMPGP